MFGKAAVTFPPGTCQSTVYPKYEIFITCCAACTCRRKARNDEEELWSEAEAFLCLQGCAGGCRGSAPLNLDGYADAAEKGASHMTVKGTVGAGHERKGSRHGI